MEGGELICQRKPSILLSTNEKRINECNGADAHKGLGCRLFVNSFPIR
jgi:hypothetical protein